MVINTTVEFLRLRWVIKDGPIADCIHVLDDPENPKSTQQSFWNADGTAHEVGSASICFPPTSHITVSVPVVETHQKIEGYKQPHAPELQVAAQGDFITIVQYVTAVHPWLVQQRHEILQAQINIEDNPLLQGSLLWVSPMSVREIAVVASKSDVFEAYWEAIAEEPPLISELIEDEKAAAQSRGQLIVEEEEVEEEEELPEAAAFREEKRQELLRLIAEDDEANTIEVVLSDHEEFENVGSPLH